MRGKIRQNRPIDGINRVHTSIYLDADLMEEVARMATEQKVSRAWVMERALRIGIHELMGEED